MVVCHDSIRTLQDSKGGKKKVHLSLKVSDVSSGIDKASLYTGAVLPAVIRTVEEHGSVLSLGVDGVSSFLPAASYTAAFGSGVKPLPGQLLQVVIKQMLRSGSSVIVGCEAAEVAKATLTAENAITMSALLPGHLVTVCFFSGLSQIPMLSTRCMWVHQSSDTMSGDDSHTITARFLLSYSEMCVFLRACVQAVLSMSLTRTVQFSTCIQLSVRIAQPPHSSQMGSTSTLCRSPCSMSFQTGWSSPF